jgi:hypothetical protein
MNNLSRSPHILCNQTAGKLIYLYSVSTTKSSGWLGSAVKLSTFTETSCTCRKYVQLVYGSNCREFRSSCINAAATQDSREGSDSDSDEHIRPALDSVLPSVPPPTHVDIVPGKGPPPEPPVDCCMSGCANCVWIQYAEELKNYYSLDQGSKKAKEAIELIDNPGLKMFLKVELGLL